MKFQHQIGTCTECMTFHTNLLTVTNSTGTGMCLCHNCWIETMAELKKGYDQTCMIEGCPEKHNGTITLDTEDGPREIRVCSYHRTLGIPYREGGRKDCFKCVHRGKCGLYIYEGKCEKFEASIKAGVSA